MPSARHLPVGANAPCNLSKVLAQFLSRGATPEPVPVVGRVDREARKQREDRRRVRTVQCVGRFEQSERLDVLPVAV